MHFFKELASGPWVDDTIIGIDADSSPFFAEFTQFSINFSTSSTPESLVADVEGDDNASVFPLWFRRFDGDEESTLFSSFSSPKFTRRCSFFFFFVFLEAFDVTVLGLTTESESSLVSFADVAFPATSKLEAVEMEEADP